MFAIFNIWIYLCYNTFTILDYVLLDCSIKHQCFNIRAVNDWSGLLD